MTATEDIETALDAAGVAWTRRDGRWAFPAVGVSRELIALPTPEGMRVEALLVAWEDALPDAVAALRHFLNKAVKSLPGVECVLEAAEARIVIALAHEQLEAQLSPAIEALSVACRLLARESAALLVPDLSRHYMSFHFPNE
jgi:hypothetical protein